MVKITGQKIHSDRLKRMYGGRSKSEMDRALYAAGNLIQVEAQTSITTGAIQGAGHVPSAPNSPPNADTGELHNNIFTVPIRHGRVNVEATAPYAVFLEWGTSRMIERPFMRPAAQKEGPKAQDIISVAVRRTTR